MYPTATTLFATTRRKSDSTMKPATVTWRFSALVATILFFSSISRRIEASGVFELEFIKFELLDLPPRLASENLDHPMHRTNESHHPSHEAAPKSPLQVFVCLKPAFTSQLDGPCTYGNASTTLIKESSVVIQDPPLTTDLKQQVPDQQAGYLATNLVRIPFTFRWTKSFTIVVTGEQPTPDTENQRPTRIKNQHRYDDLDLQNDSASASRPTTIYSPSSQVASAGGRASAQFIYRHVLTENEVLPNLELNSNKPWASRFSRTLNSSLAYRFRIYCSLNYYGDGCTTFCRARDDQFGHYNCSASGQKMCMDGWHGTDCDRAKCRSGCNQQHGFCEKPDTCNCFDGWTGSRCDECKTHPKCKNGYCLTKNDCLCHKGWGGQLCDQNLNYCGTHEPCKNNGTCQNIPPGGYKCTCPSGFFGLDCEINQNSSQLLGSITRLSAGCAVNPCLNGGTCFGYEGGVPVAINENFNEHGENLTLIDEQLEDNERIYRCQCKPGWTGDYCQWPDTDLISIADIVSDTEKLSSSSSSTAASMATTSASDNSYDIEKFKTVMDKAPPILSTFIEAPKPEPTHLDMRHLISGVVIASVVGVLLAFLFLAWCCLVAIEQNRFSFIQMNIIRSSGSDNDDVTVSSTLRRMHAKIRDSFRLSRNRIKPETKLSIENVLRPPPTYEESSNHHDIYHQKKQVEYVTIDHEKSKALEVYIQPCTIETNASLVNKEHFEQELYQSSASSNSEPVSDKSERITDAQLNCPRHGHMYRKRTMVEAKNHNPYINGESLTHHRPQMNSHFSTHLHISSTSHGSTHHTHLNHI